jgi:hypothetical protein
MNIKSNQSINLMEVQLLLGFRHTNDCYEAIAYGKINSPLLRGFRDQLGSWLKQLKEQIAYLLGGQP